MGSIFLILFAAAIVAEPLPVEDTDTALELIGTLPFYTPSPEDREKIGFVAGAGGTIERAIGFFTPPLVS